VQAVRKINRWGPQQLLNNSKFLPLAVLKMRTWLAFCVDYVGLGRANRTYVFRNGIRIATHDYMDTATIGVIFLRKDYGAIDDANVILDVGANIGVFSIYAACMAPRAVVHAYEPMLNNFELLQNNIQRNNLQGRIHAHPLGFAARREKRDLFLSDIHVGHTLFSRGHEHDHVSIDCISLKDALDDNQIETCDLLKLDCEGAEFECLYNTPDDYLARIRRIRLEYHEHVSALAKNNNVTDLSRFLESRGFQVRKIQKEQKDRGMLWVERSGQTAGLERRPVRER
jgi:FkbM family methyltransferase